MHIPEPNYSPHAPIDDEEGGNELIDDLVDRAVTLIGPVSREQVVEAMREYSPVWVQVAIGKAEKLAVPPRSWGFIVGMMANWRREKAIVRLPRPKGKLSEAQCAEPPQNYNPGIGRRDVGPPEPGAAELLRDLIRRNAPQAPSPARSAKVAFKMREEPGFRRLEAELEAKEKARRAAAPAPVIAPVAAGEAAAAPSLIAAGAPSELTREEVRP